MPKTLIAEGNWTDSVAIARSGQVARVVGTSDVPHWVSVFVAAGIVVITPLQGGVLGWSIEKGKRS